MVVDYGFLNQFVEEATFYNRFVLSHLLPESLWEPLPHFLQTWLRSYLAGTLFYFITSFLWCFYIYYLKINVYIPKDSIPTRKAMILQIYVSMKAMPWYTLLPTVSGYMIERGWTKCYSTLDQFNWFLCLLYIVLYLVLVEFGVYWVHRELHDIKFLYKHLHATHHNFNKQNTLSPFARKSHSQQVYFQGVYWVHRELHDIKFLYKHLHATHHNFNKQNTLSPFARFAFQPLDGVLQAVPHVIALFIVPVHLVTHMSLMFLEGIWTASIHDCIHGNIWPIMGAGYHTIHHTTYKHNYGNYTIWMDWMFGSLKVPLAEEDNFNDKAK